MAGILRGDIIWANLNPARGHEQAGKRPVLILSHAVFNERSGTVIAMPLTSKPQKAGFPLTFKLMQKIAKKTTWVKISQVRVLSSARLGKKMMRLDAESIDQVILGLNEIVA